VVFFATPSNPDNRSYITLPLEAIKAETKQVEKVKPKCLECQSTNIRVAIHTLYKECNERYNFWEQAD